jgi:hypothetical protein
MSLIVPPESSNLNAALFPCVNVGISLLYYYPCPKLIATVKLGFVPPIVKTALAYRAGLLVLVLYSDPTPVF